MRKLVLGLVLVLSLAACSGPVSDAADEGDSGDWYYVTGPHGETCLIYSRSMGSNAAIVGMDCDRVIP